MIFVKASAKNKRINSWVSSFNCFVKFKIKVKKMKRILIPGAGGPMAVNVVRAIRLADEKTFLVGTDCNKYHIHLALTDKKILVPHARYEEEYVKKINEIILDYHIEFILPTHPVEIITLAKRRIDVNAKLFLPKYETVQKGQNKWESYKIWRAVGLPVPVTFFIKSKGDVRKAFDEIDTRPIWVRGSGTLETGIGVASLPCKKVEHAINWIDHFDGWGNFIASEYLPGDNLTWLSLWNKGELICSQGRKRIEYVIPHVSPSGITGAPAVSHTINRDDVNEIGPKAIFAIDKEPHGVFFIDLKCDANNNPKITEVNAGRFGTTSPYFYAKAGFNLPYISIKLAYNQPIGNIPKFNVLPPNLCWIRTLDCGPVLMNLEGIDKWAK